MTDSHDARGKRRDDAPDIHRTASIRACTFGTWCSVGPRSRVSESRFGDYSYIRNDAEIIYTEAGKFCSVAAHVRLNPGNHRMERVALHPFTYRSSSYGLGRDEAEVFDWRRSQPVVLEHDVWIGHGAVVLPGVRIGTGAAIGAGAIVTKPVPPFAVAFGNPARVRRQRFPDKVVEALLRIAWWDWPPDRLRDALMDFRQLGAAEFCAKHDPG